MTPDATTATLPATPFRGLAPLRYVDQPIFFGRDAETQLLHRLVVVYRGVLLYGESGTGKSSLLNAGLVPAVEREGMRAERVRVQPRAGEELVVERISPDDVGAPPRLASTLVGQDSSSAVYSVDAFRRRLAAAAEGPTLLLVFDQFEELVTLFVESSGVDTAAPVRLLQRGVLELVDDLLTDASLPVKLLFAFREDYLATLLDLLGPHPQLKSQYVRLTPPGADALRVMVLGPFERFPGAFGRPISAPLADRLVEAVLARSGAGASGRLSELQLACQRLWRSEDPDGLFRERGLQGLLEDELSASIDRLDETARDTAVALLSHLVTRSGVRNVVSEEDLVERTQRETGATGEELRAVLASLEGESRLVRREVRHDVAFYEIISEFLVPWIVRLRSRTEIRRVQEATAQEATAQEATSSAGGGVRDRAGSASTSWGWREEALARIVELDVLATALAPGTVDAGPVAQALEATRQHLRAARASVEDHSTSGPLRHFTAWLTGSAVERAAANIDAAEASLLMFAPPEYLRGQLPNLVAHVRRHLAPDDPRRAHIEALARDVAGDTDASDVLEHSRASIVSAVRGASAAALRDVARARSFCTVVLVTAAWLALLAAGLAVLGAADADAIPLCFSPTDTSGPITVVCPTGGAEVTSAGAGGTPVSADLLEAVISRTVSPWDVLVVELVGLLGGALAAAAALRRIRGTTTPYRIAVALALLKPPAGAITAVSGLLLIRGGLVPGFASFDSSAQILAYALVLGWGQQLLTRFVDERARQLLHDAMRDRSQPLTAPRRHSGAGGAHDR